MISGFGVPAVLAHSDIVSEDFLVLFCTSHTSLFDIDANSCPCSCNHGRSHRVWNDIDVLAFLLPHPGGGIYLLISSLLYIIDFLH